MKIVFISVVFFASTFVYAQNKAPDDVITKDDIDNCYKNINKNRDFS